MTAVTDTPLSAAAAVPLDMSITALPVSAQADAQAAAQITEAFRQGMRSLTGGVAAIAARGPDGAPLGVAATAVCSLSTTPPALLVCINASNSLGRAIAPGARFSVNVLGYRHLHLARVFGGMINVDRAERFAHGDWLDGTSGAPVLADALASFQCTVAQESITYATHIVVIGTVQSVTIGAAGEALAYRNGDFHALA